MGRKISFSMARLDKVAFITGPRLWPKVLWDLIFSLEVFSSWSSRPQKKKQKETGKPQVSQWEHRRKAISKTPNLSGSRMQFPSAAEDGLVGQRWWLLLPLPHCQPQYCIHGTNGMGPCIPWPARSHLICDRHLCSGQRLSAAEHPHRCPGSPPAWNLWEAKRSPWPPPTLQIFNQIAAVMVCICCGAFPQIILALK